MESRDLVEHAVHASTLANAPYSGFAVGAVLECAERVAIASAVDAEEMEFRGTASTGILDWP